MRRRVRGSRDFRTGVLRTVRAVHKGENELESSRIPLLAEGINVFGESGNSSWEFLKRTFNESGGMSRVSKLPSSAEEGWLRDQ
jgi:hypothetical protein